MTTQLLDRTIGSIACEIPGATRVFHQYKLDFCCGGSKSLREALERRKVEDPKPVLDALSTLSGMSQAEYRDWREVPVDTLIDHILHRYHDVHREQLPELTRLARRVEQVHGDRPTCPHGLADHLADMQQELESHMMKEEQVLFPMLRRISPVEVPAPVSMMRFEHDQHGEALARLEALTNDITPPADACNTWRALYAGLHQLREDLMQHIHLENNILFMERKTQAEHV
ncbi:iron-sulfur cluster repair protein YtfE [Orrella sp. NBD-18]|uniref:Iron-sulfur cluster repair protein YtfE n=1 Tax=Sheuella amnicola TaxID=2707330 RepID=A0A6B2R240_9BURK|nr:iron-sulfur cluster repair protein YtfE [Sheuella amnicola]NDY84391.1 iron-sulfur cluster repair protein YtfE [Sheuella amnicola]HBI82371.1 iron-sulfur cluster repair di-iron protein [Alcaligenaceae bacterium]